jgi:hypothetical protein
MLIAWPHEYGIPYGVGLRIPLPEAELYTHTPPHLAKISDRPGQSSPVDAEANPVLALLPLSVSLTEHGF